MKKQLKFLNLNLFRSIFAALLLVSFACTQDENINSIEDETLILDTDEDFDGNGLGAKKKDPKDVGGSLGDCDNPFNSSTGEHYRQYESTDVGQGTDLVSKTALNGRNVDVIKFLDDRTCAYNYEQSGSSGIYQLGEPSSNKFDSPLQPRIERTTIKVNRANGNFVSVEGDVKINRVGGRASGTWGFNDVRDQRGTYIIQAKGTHANKTIGSNDPAILLVVAKDKGNGKIALWSEQITKRGGSGTSGREMVFIKDVDKNQNFKLKMVNGFTSNTRQNIKIYINDVLEHDFNVPNTTVTINGVRKFQTGQNAKIRFGAYRCHKGAANIEWSNVAHDFDD